MIDGGEINRDVAYGRRGRRDVEEGGKVEEADRDVGIGCMNAFVLCLYHG